MELGFAETLRRRWETLGIENSTIVDVEMDDQSSDAARQQILDGAIVKEVIRDALKGKLPASPFIPFSDLSIPLLQPFLRSTLSKDSCICSNTTTQNSHGISSSTFMV
jgi:hypothetical protein